MISDIRIVSDYPKPGILFYDITTILKDANHFRQICNSLKNHYRDIPVTKVVAVESRGFFLGSALAALLNVGLVPLRKPGKLPSSVFSVSYQKEYDTDTLEIHSDALTSSDVVIIHDDVLATGGTVNASLELLSNFNIKSVYLDFLLEIESLNGRTNITHPYTDIHSLMKVP
jgi:adenine phosphoribosyltransferase